MAGAPECSGEASSRVLTEVGHDVAARPDPAHRLAAHRQRDPADLVAVGARHDAFCAGPPQVWREQAKRRGRSEPDRRTAMLDQRRDDATARSRCGEQQTGRVSDHRKGLVGIERGRASVIGCVYDHRTLRLSNCDGVYERLDSAYSGRKVVRHDERSAHGCEHRSPDPAMAQQGPRRRRRMTLVQTRFGPRPGGVPGVESPEGVWVRLRRYVARRRCSACRKRR